MELRNRALYCCFFAVAVLFCSSVVLAGDIVHHDDVAPKRPGCENNFVLVKILSFFLILLHILLSALFFLPVYVDFPFIFLRIGICGLLFFFRVC